MGRIRTIKPEFWKDPTIRSFPRDIRLTYIGLWNLADDEGRLEYDPRLIRCELYPSDDDITDESLMHHLQVLQESGRIIIYSLNGSGPQYIQIVNWERHQRINRPKPSHFPAINDESVIHHGCVSDASPPEQGTGNREQGTGTSEHGASDYTPSPSSATKDEEPQPDTLACFGKDSDAFLVANALRQSILSWKPNWNQPSDATFHNWCVQANRMLRLDGTRVDGSNGRELDTVLAVIQWLPSAPVNGDFCWRDQVLSLDKLRKQFDKLEVAMSRKKHRQTEGYGDQGVME